MKTYFLTVFSEKGDKLLNESFAALNDNDAKDIGENRLREKGYYHFTHRCVSETAKLILFHR